MAFTHHKLYHPVNEEQEIPVGIEERIRPGVWVQTLNAHLSACLSVTALRSLIPLYTELVAHADCRLTWHCIHHFKNTTRWQSTGHSTAQNCIVTAFYVGQTLCQHIFRFLGHCVHERGKRNHINHYIYSWPLTGSNPELKFSHFTSIPEKIQINKLTRETFIIKKLVSITNLIHGWYSVVRPPDFVSDPPLQLDFHITH